MFCLESCSLKKSWPFLLALFVLAQIDLASAAGWPGGLLTLLHLTPGPDDACRSMCAGFGTCLDVIVISQLARIWAKRALGTSRDVQHD